MKVNQLKTIIKQAVKEAIQEEMKDILLEAIKTPKTQIQENTPVKQKPLDKKDKNWKSKKIKRRRCDLWKIRHFESFFYCKRYYLRNINKFSYFE